MRILQGQHAFAVACSTLGHCKAAAKAWHPTYYYYLRIAALFPATIVVLDSLPDFLKIQFFSAQVFSALAFLARTGRRHGRTAEDCSMGRGRSMPVETVRALRVGPCLGNRPAGKTAFAAQEQSFSTQAPTLPHRGTLGGGRRAFFIYGPASRTSTASSFWKHLASIE